MDIIPVKLDGTNYMSWSFHLKNFVEGQGLLGYLDGTNTAPIAVTFTSSAADAKTLATWNQNNAKVVTWILNYVDSSISLALQAYTKASDMWVHLKKLYQQANKARRFILDIELAKYCQNEKTILQYYSGFLALRTERDQMLLHLVSTEFHPKAIKLQEELHVS